MPLDTAYTPLESLLLFQALRAESSFTSIGFNKISDQLKAVPLIRNAPTFEAGRLSPDALKDLYLRLLKEEARSEILDAEGPTTNGDGSINSRKRKAPSPPLPTLNDAAKHAHLIPQLVSRLYARYREVAVRDIRDTERRYDALSQEDAEGLNAPATVSNVATQPSIHNVDSVSSAPASPRIPDASLDNKPRHATLAKPDAAINRPETRNGASDHPRSATGPATPALAEIAPRSPAPNLAKKSPGPRAHRESLPPQTQGNPPQLVNTASPQLQNAQSRPPSSSHPPLPPQAGVKVPSASPTPHGASPRIPPPLQPHPQQPILAPHPQQQYQYPPQPNQGYYHQQHPHYQDRRTSHPLQPAQAQGQYAPHTPQQQGGFQLPPFYFNSGQPIPHHPNGPRGQQPQHYAQPPAYPPYQHNAPATMPRHVGRPDLLKISAALASPSKPLWKSERRSRTVTAGQSVERPEPEPLSPTLGRAKSPTKSTRSGRNREPQITVEIPVTDTGRTTRRKRGDRSPHSVVSTAEGSHRANTRSHSVSTAERPGSRGDIKNEPSTVDENEDHMDVSATPSTGPRTRKRRGTLQSQQGPPAKRKRQQSPAAEDETDAGGTPPPRSNIVMATRSFAKLTATVMNDINSHKYASYFAQPVRTKDAAGYNEVIKRPQDLKSIRAAVTAGTRNVAAITANLESPAETSDGAVELERTVDVIPPKAIVNGVQLEKEVMRMLANAVMFNPGEDGFVADTREMFEDVEPTMNAWRGADRVGEEDEETKGKRRKA